MTTQTGDHCQPCTYCVDTSALSTAAATAGGRFLLPRPSKQPSEPVLADKKKEHRKKFAQQRRRQAASGHAHVDVLSGTAITVACQLLQELPIALKKLVHTLNAKQCFPVLRLTETTPILPSLLVI